MIYMAVTLDKYELPIAVEDTAGGLASRLGISSNAVSAACTPRRKNRGGKHRGYRIIRIEEDETEDL